MRTLEGPEVFACYRGQSVCHTKVIISHDYTIHFYVSNSILLSENIQTFTRGPRLEQARRRFQLLKKTLPTCLCCYLRDIRKADSSGTVMIQHLLHADSQ